jgi:DNA topoisomerase-2
MPPKKKTYTKKDPISHVLDRPDMYVGSKRPKKIEDFIAIREDGDFKIVKKIITYSPAILRVFVEVLSNSIDNVERSKKAKIPCTMIKVSIDKETGETSVWNDGDIIPIEINETEGIYNHSLIFGHLMAGSNFDDEEERLISGRNGIGGKATNIFSKKFIVNGLDPDNKKVLEQTWTNNMRNTTEPKITDTKLKSGFTKITYFPDFKQFDLEEYTDDIINLYTKYVIDAAMLTNVKVYLNDELIPVNNLLSYSKLYNSSSDDSLLIKNKNSDVLIMPSNINEFQAISFVNGVYTRIGGAHVDAFAEAIFRPIVEKFNKKGKPQLNIKDVKQFFRLFVVSTVINPEFSSQDKEKLEAPKIDAEIKQAEINKILKWDVINEIEDIIKMKEMSVLKKSEKKKKGYTKIEGMDHANNAGGKLAHECSLILCEGLSAKTYAVAGIKKGVYGKSGRDYYGILPLRGKCLNVRNSIPTTIAKNKVITDLIQALGLRHDLDYMEDKNYKTLAYGKVIILTDADVDGLHISGLILNFFHYLFPTLLEREDPYIVSMCTPIVRVFNPKGDLLFYDENKFKKFVSEQTKAFKSKYYKGLGTTKPEDVKDTFGLKMIEYINDENSVSSMNKIFHKKFSDVRKDWLANYDPNPEFSLDDEGNIVNMEISSFLNNEVIKFSHNDCKRSIPSLFDGLKESQRKILYAVKKRNLTYNKSSLKVAQLGGYVAEHTNYHHGEQNLFDTIINMAQDYVGSNNIPLFYRDGMFGTRLVGGKDSASPRYIFTKMESLTPYIFREEDDVLLEHVVDDGDVVEPTFYIPIIPMILVNGAIGIGTGWSSSIPCYNPLDLIECIKIWLDNDGEVILTDPDDGTTISMLPEIEPWYRDFKGTIEKSKDNKKYITYGCFNKNKDKIQITELPIGMWTDKFKENAEDWLVDKKIKSLKNYSTPREVDFVITESEDGFVCNVNNMGLYSYLHITNMVLFNEKEQLKKYSIDEIINEFCILRYSFYTKRKNYIINKLEKDLKHLGNKQRFIQEIIDKTLNIMNVDEDIIIGDLEKRGYDKETKIQDVDDEDNKNGYNYLLKLPVRTLTANQIKKIKNDIESLMKELDIVKKTSEKKMWLNDLKEFEDEYTKWIKKMNNISSKDDKKDTKKKVATKKKN